MNTADTPEDNNRAHKTQRKRRSWREVAELTLNGGQTNDANDIPAVHLEGG